MMFETATMLPVAATLVALATLVGMVLLLLGCLQCLFPKKKRGFSTLEEGSELDSTRARSNPSFAPDLDTSDTVINIEPLPETIGDLRASSLSLPPLRPRITCLEKGKLDNALKLITFHHPFSRSQILYLNGIGHGWFGEVIESDAEKIISGVSKSRVVVKQLKDDASQMEQSMFLADVAAFREAEHTNVLRLLGQCTETHPFLMILEYMAMGNLKSYLRAHKNEDSLIQKHKLLKFAIDAASGLACLHRHGYAHSDFSARNCLVSADFTVKVGDYGISEENFREDYFNTGRELLPIRWMARESLALSNGTWCAQAPSKEADMWAFGVMLWEVISLGHQPYQDLSDEEVLKKVVIAEKPLKLPKPATALPMSDRLYEVMQFCWMDSKNRLKVEQAHLLLQHILSTCMEPPTSQAVPGDSFEERWNTLIPNDAKASLPKKPARVAPPPPAAREVEENISRTEAKMVTAEAAAPKVHPGSGDAPPAAAFRVQPVAPPRVSRKVDVHGGGDATAAEKPPQPPKSVDSAAIAAPVAAPRAAPRREASAVEKSTPAALASAHPGDVRPDKSDTSEVVSSSAAPATPKVDAIQTEPPKKEVPPELPVSAPAEADWGGVKVPPPKEKPEDAKSYGEGADVQAAFESLSAFDNSDSAADMDHHSSSANTTADSFLMVDVEDAAHTGLDSPMADPHRTSTPAQTSPQPGTGDSQRMHLSPDAGETTVNTTAASFFTARDASTSPGSSGFQTAEATLNKDESSTAEMFGEFTDSSLSTQPSVQDNTLPMAGQDEMVSGQHGQLLTGAGISSVEQALFEASQEEENDAPCKEGATAMQKSDFGEKTLVQEKYPSTEEGEGENWSHLAVETLSSDTSFEWEKVSATEMKDEAATSEASIGKAEDHDLSFDVASLSSTSAASGILADKASLELGSLENIGSTSNLEPAPQATESNDTSLLDAADVMSLSSSETCPPSQPEGSLEEPAAEQVSLDSSSSTEVTASPAGELSPSSGLSTPSQVAVGTKDRKLPEVAEPAAQDQLSHLPATPAAVQIVVQDFSDDAPSPGLPVSISSSPSPDSSKPPLSNVALSGDLPLSASSSTGSSDPFSFPSTASPGQDVTADPFQGLGMSEPSPGSWSEEGSVQSDKKLHSNEPQLVSTDLSTDLLGSTHGVHEDTKVDKDTIASGQSQASQSSITDNNLLGFDQFSPHNSDSSSMEPTSLVLDKAQKEKDAIFDLKPSSSSGKDSLLDFSAFEEGPGGGHSSSASTGNTAAEVTSQSLGLMPSKVDSSEKQESFSGLEGDELFGWDQLQGTGIVPAAGESTGKAPAFLPTSPAQSGSQQTASEEESMPSTLPDQNFPSLDSQASSDLLAEDSSLLDFGMATPSEAKSLHESASNVALVDLDEFAGGESTPTEGEAEATRSAVDDLLGM